MRFTCCKCDAPADRDIPTPPPDITVIYICHACAWAEDADDAPEDEQDGLDQETAQTGWIL